MGEQIHERLRIAGATLPPVAAKAKAAELEGKAKYRKRHGWIIWFGWLNSKSLFPVKSQANHRDGYTFIGALHP